MSAVIIGQLGAKQAVASADDWTVFDLVLDASGHPAAIAAVHGLGPRGRFMQMGVASLAAMIAVSPYDVLTKELSVIGSSSLADKAHRVC